MNETPALREIAGRVWRAALEAVRPERVLPRFLRRQGDVVEMAGLEWSASGRGRLRLLAIGKAADSMARAVVARVGDLIHEGLIVTKTGHACRPPPPRFESLEAAHPIPDERSLAAAARVRAFLSGGRADDLVLLLLSGGASALVADPRPSLTLDDLVAVTGSLMRAGATIHELNTVRKHLERLKGGGLLLGAAPAQVVALLLSDVIGDSPAIIGGGIAAPDPTTFDDAIRILNERRAWDTAPRAVRALLERGRRGMEPETLKPGDPRARSALCAIVASGRDAAEAVAASCTSHGLTAAILTTELAGEARETARVIAAIAREVSARNRPWPRPVAIIAGGETTVTVRGPGRGGRNQEAALAAAIELDGQPDAVWTSLGTDGTDGPTDAAGATVDGSTANTARRLGLNLAEALRNNDSHTALDRLGCLIRTGPTGTHVNDLWFVLLR